MGENSEKECLIRKPIFHYIGLMKMILFFIQIRPTFPTKCRKIDLEIEFLKSKGRERGNREERRDMKGGRNRTE